MSTALVSLTTQLAKVPFKHYRKDGEGTVTRYGYVSLGAGGIKKLAHVAIVERVLGKRLPASAEIHHVNENKSDNRNANLVVCPSKAYHKMLHTRIAAMDACGNPNYRKCPFCKQYDAQNNMKHNASSRYYYHAACKTKYRQSRRVA